MKPSLMVRIKDEIKHYKQGAQLLALEAKLSARYVGRVLQGHKLTRREHRQLKRTTTDLIRLVPFVVLVAIPFAELALPFLLRFFPNMLPSTFEKKYEVEEKRRKSLIMKMELAKFLQETVNDMEDKKEFGLFIKNLKTHNLSTDEVLMVAKKFGNDVTLENLSHQQIKTMCKFMGINAFGTDVFLRYQIRTHLNKLHKDDQMIFFEGIDTLSETELQKACLERGINKNMRQELKQWLDLHLIHKVPSALLVLSKAFEMKPHDALKTTLESLPETVIKQAEVELPDASFETKLQVLEQEESKIEEENKENNNYTKDHVSERVKELGEAIKVLSNVSSVEGQREELANLHIANKNTVVGKQVDKLIVKLNSELNEYDEIVGSKLNLIKKDLLTREDVEKTISMLNGSKQDAEKVMEVLDTDKDGKVSKEEIIKLSDNLQEQEGHGVLLKEK